MFVGVALTIKKEGCGGQDSRSKIRVFLKIITIWQGKNHPAARIGGHRTAGYCRPDNDHVRVQKYSSALRAEN